MSTGTMNRKSERLATREAARPTPRPAYVVVAWYELIAACQLVAGRRWVDLYTSLSERRTEAGVRIMPRDNAYGASMLVGWMDELRKIWREWPSS